MMHPINPFFTTNVIPAEYFCDREKETDTLVREIESGNNVLLMSSRRIGKTGLINHLFEDSRIKGKYLTFFIDIYDTSTVREFVYRLGREVYDRLSLINKARAIGFLGLLRSIRGELSVDPVSMSPRFALSVGQITNPEMTLDEIFTFLEGTKKPCVVAIDEFQSISEYEEKNVEAMLRTRMQRLKNVRFIYSGSQRHLLSQMFATQARPFYRCSSTLALERIDLGVYSEFASSLFREYGKSLSEDVVSALYELVDGYTYYLQRTLSLVFYGASPGTIVTKETMIGELDNLLSSEETNFKSLLSMLTANQRQLLSAIAISGKAVNILSAEFVSRFSLGIPSSVQSASRSLLKKQLISRTGDTYTIDDKYLELWLRRSAGLPLIEG